MPTKENLLAPHSIKHTINDHIVEARFEVQLQKEYLNGDYDPKAAPGQVLAYLTIDGMYVGCLLLQCELDAELHVAGHDAGNEQDNIAVAKALGVDGGNGEEPGSYCWELSNLLRPVIDEAQGVFNSAIC